MDNVSAIQTAEPPLSADEPLVSVRGLRKAYDNDKNDVLDGIDWDIPRGRVIGLLGRNGAGAGSAGARRAGRQPQTRTAFMNELMQIVRRHDKTVILSTHITADPVRV